jgi:hypothetical protein
MGVFVARHAFLIATLIIVAVLYAQWRLDPNKLRDSIVNIGFGIPALFITVALAIQQTAFDRAEQRLEEVHTTALAVATSLPAYLDNLAAWLAISYDSRFPPQAFAVPPSVVRLEGDERVVATIGIDTARKLSQAIAALKASSEQEDLGAAAVRAVRKRNGVSDSETSNRIETPSKSRENLDTLYVDYNPTCLRDYMVARHLIAVSRVLTEVCVVISKTDQPIPEFLKSSTIASPRQPGVPIFAVKNCSVVAADPLPNESSSYRRASLLNINSLMKDLELAKCGPEDKPD